MADYVYLQAPDGRQVKMEKSSIKEALAAGYFERAPSGKERAEAAAANQGAQAFNEGVGRGLTFGVSDQINASLAEAQGYDPTAFALGADARAQTGAATAGEIFGGVATMIGGPGAALAKGEAAVAKAAGGRLAGRALGGAASGSVLGLGGLVSEKALKNQALTSEDITSRMLGGALLGSALSGAFYGVQRGASAALGTLGEAELSKPLNSLADFLDKGKQPPAPINMAQELFESAPGMGALMGGPKGYVAGLAYNLIKKHGPPRLAGALRGLSESGLINKVAQDLESRISAMGDPTGVLKYPLLEAAAEGPAQLFEVHAAVAKSPEGPLYLQQLGLSPEGPDQNEDINKRTATLMALQRDTDKAEKAMDGRISAFFGSKRGPAKEMAKTTATVKDLETQVERLKAIVADPDNVFSAVPPTLAGAAPATAMQAAASVANGAMFLLDKAPKDPNGGMPTALKRPWAPSPADLQRWSRYMEATQNPGAVLANMQTGNVPKEHMEVLQNVYPAMLDEFRAKVTERLMDLQHPIPYEKKLALTRLLGPQVLGFTPQRMQILQNAHATVANKPQGGGAPDGRQDRDVEKSMATQGQKLENR